MLLSLPQPERMPFHPAAGAADEIADLDRRLDSPRDRDRPPEPVTVMAEGARGRDPG